MYLYNLYLFVPKSCCKDSTWQLDREAPPMDSRRSLPRKPPEHTRPGCNQPFFEPQEEPLGQLWPNNCIKKKKTVHSLLFSKLKPTWKPTCARKKRLSWGTMTTAVLTVEPEDWAPGSGWVDPGTKKIKKHMVTHGSRKTKHYINLYKIKNTEIQ